MTTSTFASRRLTRRALIAGGSAAAAWTLGVWSTPGRAATGEDVIFESTSGKVRGVAVDGIKIFKGVPYGASTAGAARFLPPRKPQTWSGVRDALEYGPRAWQAAFFPGSPVPPGPAMNEDCLVLNVWTPALRDNGRRPVMVWLHGGGFGTGSGGGGGTDGANLARNYDVVVVSLNHRLNIFGYLDLAGLGDSRFADSGNAGMLDQVLALHWVRENIGNLGGDPGNVTIFGQSGGGMKVATLMAMPAAKGLFHKAIVQSGSQIRAVEREPARQTAREVMATLGLRPDQVAELQKVPPEKMLEAMRIVDKAPYTIGTHQPLYLRPVVDGKSLPAHPCDPAPQLSADIPAIIGSARDEMPPPAAPMDDAELRARVSPLAGPDQAAKLIDLARKAHPQASNSEICGLLASESFRFDGITQAERRSALHRAPSWLYVFSWEDEVRKAFHGIEIPFVFDNAQLVKRHANGSPEVESLAKMASGAWVAFARTGNPNHAGMPDWQPFDERQRLTMVFDTQSRVLSDPTGVDRLTLKAVGL
jgi:para-nitrobenzyl esterase